MAYTRRDSTCDRTSGIWRDYRLEPDADAANPRRNSTIFYEVVIAPTPHPKRGRFFGREKNLRLLTTNGLAKSGTGGASIASVIRVDYLGRTEGRWSASTMDV